MNQCHFLLAMFLASSLVADVRAEKTSDSQKAGDEYVFKLISGGEIRGKFVNVNERPYRRYVIQTHAGGSITLAKEEVESFILKPARQVEYERIAPTYPDTVTGHLALAQWCRKNYLVQARKDHLHRVIELDPEHSQVRSLLGYRKIKGTWYTRQQYMENVVGKHYIPGKGWLLPQELQLREERRIRESREREQFVTMKRLRTMYGKSSRRRESIDEFMKINSPYAVKAIAYYYDPKREKSVTVRRLFVRVLENINSSAATTMLADAALYDPNKDVRLDALEILGERKQKFVVRRFIARLVDADHRMIDRAGIALSYMGDKSAIGPLINALVSTHMFIKRTGGGTSASFNTGGGPGGGLRSGVRTVRYKRTFENPGVRIALLTLTDQNYGYDVAQWKAWYATQQRTQTVDVRRD